MYARRCMHGVKAEVWQVSNLSEFRCRMLTIPGPAVLDINTQRDFYAAQGTALFERAGEIAELTKTFFTFLGRQKISVVSTRLRDINVQITPGVIRNVAQGDNASKLPFTLLRHRAEFPADCATSLPIDGSRTYQQFVFDIPSLNLFESPRLDRVLSENDGNTWYVLGGPLEWTLRTAVLGLLQRRHKVIIIKDAIGMWDTYEGDMAVRQIESKNVEWMTVADAIARLTPRLAPRRVITPAQRAAMRRVSEPVGIKRSSGKNGKEAGKFRM